MEYMLNRISLLIVLSIIMTTGTAAAFWGKDKGDMKQTEKKIEADLREENKLVQLDSLENAFLKSVQRRQLLALNILNLQGELNQTDDEKKKKDITEQLEKAQKDLAVLNVAMDVVFSPAQPRQYEYNPVKSMVYVKVGNMEQIFIRMVRVRDALLQAIQEKQKKLDDETEDKKKKEIEKAIQNLQRQYQTVVASQQLVFDIVPQRNYFYNPKDSTLYLRVTEDEAKKIQEKMDEMSKQVAKKREADITREN